MKNAMLFLLTAISVIACGQNNVPVSQLPALAVDSATNADFFPVVHRGRYYKFTLGGTDTIFGGNSFTAQNGVYKTGNTVGLGAPITQSQSVISLNQNSQGLIIGDTNNFTLLGIGNLTSFGLQPGSLLLGANDINIQSDSSLFQSQALQISAIRALIGGENEISLAALNGGSVTSSLDMYSDPTKITGFGVNLGHGVNRNAGLSYNTDSVNGNINVNLSIGKIIGGVSQGSYGMMEVQSKNNGFPNAYCLISSDTLTGGIHDGFGWNIDSAFVELLVHQSSNTKRLRSSDAGIIYQNDGVQIFSVDTLGFVHYSSLDSVQIYTTPSPVVGMTIYCSDCTGGPTNNLSGGLVTYTGTLWRRDF